MDSLPGNRRQKVNVYERAMDGAAKRNRDAIEGQLSLFGFTEETVVAPEIPMPDFPDFDLADRLQMEKETTGVYITGASAGRVCGRAFGAGGQFQISGGARGGRS